MVHLPEPAELSGLFLRYCRNWQRLVQVTTLVAGALLLIVYGALISGLSGYVWLLSLIAAYTGAYLRDAQLSPPARAGAVDVGHAFNAFSVVPVIALYVSAFVSVIVWACAEDMMRIAGHAGGFILTLALVGHGVDLMFVEGARVFVIFKGRETAFLASLWLMGVQHAPQTATPHRRFVVMNTDDGGAPHDKSDPQILLDE